MVIKGQQIKRLRTMGSKFDNGEIVIAVVEGPEGKEELFRIKVWELIKTVKGFEFDTERKTVHTYLTNARPTEG